VCSAFERGQHRSLLSPGGADAKITNPTESRSIQTAAGQSIDGAVVARAEPAIADEEPGFEDEVLAGA
jgi:hypothetical protein